LTPIRLNLGSGSQPLPGYLNLDISDNNPVYPLPYADNSIDEIRASHILEHFGKVESAAVLNEWHRVLKVGGILKIAVPDFAVIAEAYTNGQNPEFPFESVVMGGQSDQYDFHKSMWDLRKLFNVFTCLGYTNIVRWVSEIQDCASLNISLNLQGEKRE
jgi:predicted SAM-dependent methyltransferase